MDLRRIVVGTQLTRMRYDEFVRSRVADFNPDGGTVTVTTSKSGATQRVVLTDEANRPAHYVCKPMYRAALVCYYGSVERQSERGLADVHARLVRATLIRDHVLPLVLALGTTGPEQGGRTLFWRPPCFTIAHAAQFTPKAGQGGVSRAPHPTLDIWYGASADPVLSMCWTINETIVSAFVTGQWEAVALALGATRH